MALELDVTQSLAVPSLDAVMMYLPSGLNAALVTIPVTAWLNNWLPAPSRVKVAAAALPALRAPVITPPVKSVTELAKSPKITLPFILPAFDTFAAASMTWIAGPLIPLIVAPALFVIVPPLTRRMPIPPVIVPEFATSITAVPIVPTPTPLTPPLIPPALLVTVPAGTVPSDTWNRTPSGPAIVPEFVTVAVALFTKTPSL